jgi:hypothetical protein
MAASFHSATPTALREEVGRATRGSDATDELVLPFVFRLRGTTNLEVALANLLLKPDDRLNGFEFKTLRPEARTVLAHALR